MHIKVCGLTSLEEVAVLDQLGVDFAGFIFYPKSPRYVLDKLSRSQLKSIKERKIKKIGVFVNAPEDQVIETIYTCGLQMVQLHGDETPKYCEKIANYISVVKAFRLSEQEDVLGKVKDYQTMVGMYLFDKESSQFGGTGKKFDWDLLMGLDINKPFFLSGGIGPEDLKKLQSFQQDSVSKDLFAIDVNSRFELAPGVKNLPLIENFVSQIKIIK